MTLTSARIGPRGAFDLASEPGLFDRPDRAIAALQALALDTEASPASRARRLDELLRSDGDVRFWTEESMRVYVKAVNGLLADLGRRLEFGAAGSARLGLKCSNRPTGRYTLFRLRSHAGRREACRRNLPSGLSLSRGPS